MRPCPFSTNQMQISINSINGQCLLAVKIAQRLLVSGSKMDDRWPGTSQRSKMTITLKCNLCWLPPKAWPSAASRQTGLALGPAARSASSLAGGLRASRAVPSGCPYSQVPVVLLSSQAEPTHSLPTAAPMTSHRRLQKSRVLLSTPFH